MWTASIFCLLLIGTLISAQNPDDSIDFSAENDHQIEKRYIPYGGGFGRGFGYGGFGRGFGGYGRGFGGFGRRSYGGFGRYGGYGWGK